MGETIRHIAPEVLFSAIGEQLAAGRQAIFTVTGMSMWPFLCHGRDEVVIEACDPRSLKKGDILLLQTPPGTYLLHRVTALREDCFETTGDGLCRRDGWFPRSCVRARAVKLIRRGREIRCDAPGWKFVFRVWMGLFPIRRSLLWLLRRLGRLRRFFSK